MLQHYFNIITIILNNTGHVVPNNKQILLNMKNIF